MMKLFFGLMDKINRPLHIIDLSPFPRCDEKETSQNRCGGRKTKEQRCCVLSEREDDTTKRRSVVDAQKKKKKKKKMMMMMKKRHERKDTEGRRVFGSKEDTHFFPLFSSLFFLTKRHAFSKAKQSD